MQTKFVTVAETKRELSRLLRELNDQYYLITRYGKPQAVLVSYDTFTKLESKQPSEDELAKRRAAFQRIKIFRKELKQGKGSFQDILDENRAQLEKRGLNGILGR